MDKRQFNYLLFLKSTPHVKKKRVLKKLCNIPYAVVSITCQCFLQFKFVWIRQTSVIKQSTESVTLMSAPFLKGDRLEIKEFIIRLTSKGLLHFFQKILLYKSKYFKMFKNLRILNCNFYVACVCTDIANFPISICISIP